jgi:hypothetical protein
MLISFLHGLVQCSVMTKTQLNLKGFDFQELLTAAGLHKLDQRFLTALHAVNPQWHNQLLLYRNNAHFAQPEVISQLLIDCAVVLETFLAQLFDIETAVAALQAQILADQPIFVFRTYYVMKLARRAKPQHKFLFSELNQFIEDELLSKKLSSPDRQLAIAKLGLLYLQDAAQYQTQMTMLVEWCVQVMNSAEGREYAGAWEMFHFPKHLDYTNLVAVQPLPQDAFGRLQGIAQRARDGFALTDQRMSERQALWEIDYCVYCHKNQGDFCSR